MVIKAVELYKMYKNSVTLALQICPHAYPIKTPLSMVTKAVELYMPTKTLYAYQNSSCEL